VRRHPFASGVLVVVSGVVLGAVLLLLTPLLDDELSASTAPASGYDAARVLADELQSADGPEVNEVCRSRVYDQGERADVAVVLLHGYTNCPQQWDDVAAAYVDAGYNVVVPRLPGHGEADRLTSALSDITPRALVETTDLAIDIGAGMGDEVWVAGLSGGGTLAGWAAAERDEVTRAVLLAPLVVPKVVPEVLVGPLSRAFRFGPDVALWWDGEKRESLASPPYAYPRYTLRSLGAFLAVGRSVQGEDDSRTQPLQTLTLVTNENDNAISNSGAAELADAVQEVSGGGLVDRQDYVFDAALQYRHDVVDPQGENAGKIDEIYPVLGPYLGLEGLTG
jgi:pimeloyl-ACP methyl ester carboxylesterase